MKRKYWYICESWCSIGSSGYVRRFACVKDERTALSLSKQLTLQRQNKGFVYFADFAWTKQDLIK